MISQDWQKLSISSGPAIRRPASRIRSIHGQLPFQEFLAVFSSAERRLKRVGSHPFFGGQLESRLTIFIWDFFEVPEFNYTYALNRKSK